MTDPIADMFVRIKNANQMRYETVEVPTSQIKLAILNVMKNEGYIADYSATEGTKSVTTITLKYMDNKDRVIKGIKRISKPSLRRYAGADKLPYVLNGLGTAIISTSKGVKSDKEARKLNLGGEIIAYIW
ncbi:MAG: 30S ribosomal protein S8 [Acholeplasmatales bacterium]|jgi:small subunit ribosomal protein S8|nr:30S ribosomal protein S8 [Acholeplasmatales bacterium]